MMASCINCLLQVPFRRVTCPDDTVVTRQRKQIAIVMGTLGFFLSATVVLAIPHPSVYKMASVGLFLSVSIFQLTYVLYTKTAPTVLLEVVTCIWTFGLMCAAYVGYMAGLPPQWQFIVPLLDLCLVLQLPTRATSGVITITVSCLVGFQVLLAVGRHLPDVVDIKYICECPEPPCRPSAMSGFFLLVQDMGVLILDFYLTRGFAWKVLEEKASMQSTIDAVQRIAQHLSEYDVDSVAEILDEREGDMPAEMAAALRAVEANLRQYRPYLPDALFEQYDHFSGTREAARPRALAVAPGMQTNEVTIAFTDIRASTCIWEVVPEAMAKAIRVHNTAIRGVIATCQGYEVKTVGDAFMVAFETAADGVNFGLRVQTALAEADWPAALLQMPICTARGTLWRGLTVRVGVNSGPVTPEVSEVTGRVDYFGHTVNVASRLESVCTPGAVCLRADLWAHVQGACDAAVAGPATEVELKGVKGKTSISCVVPSLLQERLLNPLESVIRAASTELRTLSLSTSLKDRLPFKELQQSPATVGVVQVTMGNTGPADLSNSLEELTLHLTRSTGTLVTVLGNSVAVGWNVSRRLNSHAESSLCFARGATESVQCHVGLASGSVEHGDIGSARQRFVTVVGPAVHASWALSEAACEHSKLCLFAWMYNTPSGVGVLPTSLAEHLCRSVNVSVASVPPDSLHELLAAETPLGTPECFFSPRRPFSVQTEKTEVLTVG